MQKKLYSFQFEGKIISLAQPNADDDKENTYTVIIGKNGVGKSRLLAALAKDQARPIFNKKVIAASTSPFDKFPIPLNKKPYEFSDNENYRYIGMRNGKLALPSSIALISSAAKGLLENIILQTKNLRLADVFEALNFKPIIKLTFKSRFAFRRIKDFDSDSKNFDSDYFEFESNQSLKSLSEKIHRHKLSLDAFHPLKEFIKYSGLDFSGNFGLNSGDILLEELSKMNEADREATILAMIHLHRKIENKAFSLEFDFFKNELLVSKENLGGEIIHSLYLLLICGFVRLIDLELEKTNKNERISLKQASSGEQCMLALILGIAGHITDNSLILIDEPEISLHPEWQENFMPLLMQAFSGFKNCQFLIATHSPQIISRLKADNCYILSLSKEQLFSSEKFFHKSADYQLAELFDAPGLMNEYISRVSFNLLAKVKSSKTVTKENKIELAKIMLFSEKIDKDDPMRELIFSIKSICEFYEQN